MSFRVEPCVTVEEAASATQLAEGDGVGAGLGDRVASIAESGTVLTKPDIGRAMGRESVGGLDDPDSVRAGSGVACVGG